MNRVTACALALICLIPASAGTAGAPAQAQAAAKPPLKAYVVDYYYKVKWGHFDEFLDLYKRNHYPILKRMQQDGHILSMTAAYPYNHASEGARWDMRFTIVYRDVLAEHQYDGTALVKELYPDQAKFKEDERRRFELLLEHVDVPMVIDDLSAWK